MAIQCISTNIFLFSNHLGSDEMTRSPVSNTQPPLLTLHTNSKLCIIINNCSILPEQTNLKSAFEHLNFQALLCNHITHSDIRQLFNDTSRIQELTVLAVFIFSERNDDIVNDFERMPIEPVLVDIMNHISNAHKTDKLVFVQTICCNGDYDITKPDIQLCILEKCIYFHISTNVSIVSKFISILTSFPNCFILNILSQLLPGQVYVQPNGYDFILNSMERYV